MNIAIDIRNVGKGRTGSEVVVVELFRVLLGKEYTKNDTFYLLTDTKDPSVLARIEEIYQVSQRDNVHVKSLAGGGRGLWILWHAPQFVRRMDIDVYHTEYIIPFFIVSSTRVITHVHDVSFCDPAIRPHIKKRDLFFLDLLMPRSVRRADTIIAVSQFTHEQIGLYYPHAQDKIVHIDNACGQLFSNKISRDDRRRVRTRYALPEKYIFSIGTMQPRKNIPFLIQAFVKIAHKIPDIHLVLSGKTGHNWDVCIDSVAEDSMVRERIHFTGFIDEIDLPAVYAEAHTFAFPSLYEGFGLPLLEAMSAEVPIVASDIAVHHEVAEGAAAYADPRSIDRYAEALYTVCTSKHVRDDLLKRSASVCSKYSWSRSADEIYTTMKK